MLLIVVDTFCNRDLIETDKDDYEAVRVPIAPIVAFFFGRVDKIDKIEVEQEE